MFFYGWRGIFLDIENRVEHQNKIKRPAGTGRFVLCLAFTGLSQTPIIIITTVLFYSLLSIILLYPPKGVCESRTRVGSIDVFPFIIV